MALVLTVLQRLHPSWILHATIGTHQMIAPGFIAFRNVHVTERTAVRVRFCFVAFLDFHVYVVVAADGLGASRALLIFDFLFAFTE